MEILRREIELPSMDSHVTIAPLGDIQWQGAHEAVAGGHLKAHIGRALAEPCPLFVGMGDYVDFMSPSNRTRLANADLYDNSQDVIEDAARRLVVGVEQEFLGVTAGRWLGLLSGHHYYNYQNGESTDTELSEKLGTTFLGTCAYIRLDLSCGAWKDSVLIWAHHGEGSGQSAAAPVQKLERIQPRFEGDIFLLGHMTKVAHAVTPRIRPVFYGGSARLEDKDVHLVGTGGWSLGYRNRDRGRKEGDYVEKKMLPPVALGAPLIRIHPAWNEGRASRRISVEI